MGGIFSLCWQIKIYQKLINHKALKIQFIDHFDKSPLIQQMWFLVDLLFVKFCISPAEARLKL